MSPESRTRLGFALMVAAALAYLFFRLAYSSWYWWARTSFHMRWLVFQNWRWWVGALIACIALLIAGAHVISGDRKSRWLPRTPIDDPAHRLFVDERGRETEPRSDSIEDPRTATFSYVPSPGDAAHADDTHYEPRRDDRRMSPWLLSVFAAVIALPLLIDWLGNGTSIWLLAAEGAISALVVGVWWFLRHIL